MNGFDLAKSIMDWSDTPQYFIAGVGVYVIFIAAVLSIIYTLYLLCTKKDLCSSSVFKVDITILLLSIAGGALAGLLLIHDFGRDVFERGSYFY